MRTPPMIIASICTIVLVMTALEIFFPTQLESRETKPKYLVVALLQSSNDLEYIKPIQKWFIKIYTEALSRLDIALDYRVLPPKRASLYSDDGRLDGELSRVFDYNTNHPNLVRVEEHHLLSVFSAFALEPTIKLDKWQSLKNTNYRIEYRRGIKKSAEKLSAIIPSKHLSAITSIQAGIGKLLTGRTDIFIDSEDGIFNYIKTEAFQELSRGKKIHKVGTMEIVTSHFWLHKKHETLAPQLSAILREMKKEGLFDLYLKQLKLDPSQIKWRD